VSPHLHYLFNVSQHAVKDVGSSLMPYQKLLWTAATRITFLLKSRYFHHLEVSDVTVVTDVTELWLVDQTENATGFFGRTEWD